ncbi:retropepsin-like aspartic protease [Thalassobellus suaedae]|uniref:Retropepsin-like aspartic protease n=1 Tax=Thalassobellus suaedae TaxID=3074124 RepID=A0ABY9XP33_9FLAO|nr:retropepsin-like aspartic protease [Flavobacteriaceae bacterium HL-DH14]
MYFWSDIFHKKYIDTIKFETYSNAIILPVYINNKKYNFQFDTGASTIISKELFSKLNLSIIDSEQAKDHYGNIGKMDFSMLPKLTIGKTEFTNIKVGILKPIQSFKSCGVKIDGYLGNDVLANGAIQIDIKNKKLLISNSIKSINVKNNDSFDIELDFQKRPFLIVNFMGLNAYERVLFDTGSCNNIYKLEKKTFLGMLENEHIKTNNIIDTLESLNKGSGIFGKQNDDENYYVNFDSIKVTGVKFYNFPAHTFNSGGSSILGAEFLTLGKVSIDYKNKKIYFNQYKNKKNRFIL